MPSKSYEKNKTFIRITNKQIYEKLESIDNHVNRINGKVLWHTWAIGFIVVVLVAVISQIL